MRRQRGADFFDGGGAQRLGLAFERAAGGADLLQSAERGLETLSGGDVEFEIDRRQRDLRRTRRARECAARALRRRTRTDRDLPDRSLAGAARACTRPSGRSSAKDCAWPRASRRRRRGRRAPDPCAGWRSWRLDRRRTSRRSARTAGSPIQAQNRAYRRRRGRTSRRSVAPVRSRARAIISAETSTPITPPAAPTWDAMASVVAPPPQPTSMTRSPGASRARA